MAKTFEEIINKEIKALKIKQQQGSAKTIQEKWKYKDSYAYWTNAQIAIRIKMGKEYNGVSDIFSYNPYLREDETMYPNIDKLIPDDISDWKELNIKLPAFALNAEKMIIKDGFVWIVGDDGSLITDTDLDITAGLSMKYYKFVQGLGCKIYVKDNIVYAIATNIEIVFKQISIESDYTPPFKKIEEEEQEEEMQEEVESERQTNEEAAESLNDRHEEEMQEEIQEEEQEEEKDTQEQEELPDDTDVYDIVFNYLIKNACVPTSNGNGGLNIDCPYQKKDIVKSLGAMWSPRYYRWYLRADRLEKAANIIKAM